MKTSKILTITAIAFALSMNNFATAKGLQKSSSHFKVAVVDVQKVVESSPKISALKVDRKNKLDDLGKFVEKAKADVAKETDVKRRKHWKTVIIKS